MIKRINVTVFSNEPPLDTNVIWIKPYNDIYYAYIYENGDWRQISSSSDEDGDLQIITSIDQPDQKVDRYWFKILQ